MPVKDSRFIRTRNQEATEAFNKLPEYMQIIVHVVTLRRQSAVYALLKHAGNYFIRNGMQLNDLSFPAKRVMKPGPVSEALKKARQSNIEEYNNVLSKHWAFTLHKVKGRIVIEQG